MKQMETAMQRALTKALRDPKLSLKFVQQEIAEEGDEMGEYHPGILPKGMSKKGKGDGRGEK